MYKQTRNVYKDNENVCNQILYVRVLCVVYAFPNGKRVFSRETYMLTCKG